MGVGRRKGKEGKKERKKKKIKERSKIPVTQTGQSDWGESYICAFGRICVAMDMLRVSLLVVWWMAGWMGV